MKSHLLGLLYKKLSTKLNVILSSSNINILNCIHCILKITNQRKNYCMTREVWSATTQGTNQWESKVEYGDSMSYQPFQH